jgi:hypothetical protein
MDGKPNQPYSVEVYVSKSGDDHGIGQGQTYLGTARAVTDANGKGAFKLPLNLPDPLGDGSSSGYFTATATDAAGSTSTFSRSIPLHR